MTRRNLVLTLAASATAARSIAEPAAALVSDPPRDWKPQGAHLGTLLSDVERIAALQGPGASFLNHPESGPQGHAAWLAQARQRVLDLLQYEPPVVDPAPEILERRDCGDHWRERITFATAPGLRVPAYVLVPKGLKGRAPAMVDLHSHGGMFLFGKEKVVDLGQGANHPAMVRYHAENYGGRPTATALVRRGYVVISIDALMFGERRAVLDEDLAKPWDRAKLSLEEVRQLNQQCRAREATLVKALVFAGATWPGVVSWDDRRTVDYLLTRPEVDPERIGCQGVSMGGYRALFLTALDARVRAGCIAGFMSTVRPMLKRHVDSHSWVHYLPGLHRHLDWPDLAGMAAPRGLLVLQCAQDGLFPPEGMRESVEKIETLFAKAGCPDQFTGRFHEGPHQYSVPMQEEAFAWFDRMLAA